jgi:protein required for attachment to host cells
MAMVRWILVADRTRGRLLHALPAGRGPFPTLACFVHEEGRLQSRERDTDEPGRVIHPAGYVSAVEPHEDQDLVQAKRFAAQLVAHLERSRQERRFDQLIVIVPPKFLGVLRDAWTPSLQNMIQSEIAQDLMPLSDAELQRRLDELLAAPAA